MDAMHLGVWSCRAANQRQMSLNGSAKKAFEAGPIKMGTNG
jgi:hypothetical protein